MDKHEFNAKEEYESQTYKSKGICHWYRWNFFIYLPGILHLSSDMAQSKVCIKSQHVNIYCNMS